MMWSLTLSAQIWGINRAQMAGGLGVLAVGATLPINTFASWWLVAFVCSLTLMLLVGGVEARSTGFKWATAVLLGSLGLGVLASHFWAPGADGGTAYIFAWTGLVVGFAYANRATVRRVLALMPFLYLANALALYAEAVNGIDRGSGITINPNPAGGLLVVGVVWTAMDRRLWWLSPVLLGAIPLTGSRNAAVVVLGILLALVLVRRVGIRRVALTVAAAAILAAPFHENIQDGYRWTFPEAAQEESSPASTSRIDRAASSVAPNLKQAARDALMKLNPVVGPSLLPRGVMGPMDELHSVYGRVAAEAGLVGFLAWSALLYLALRRRRLSSRAWWMLASLAALGTLDYYMWMPAQLTAMWWLLIGANTREQT